MNKNTDITLRRNQNDDEDSGWTPFGTPQAKVSKRTSPSHEYILYLDEGIREPAYYRDHIETLTNAGPSDVVFLYINSPGGRLDSACAIISAIENCEGEVVARLMGDTHSAASMIALSAPSIQVSPYCTMLIHEPSFGVGNSASLVYSQVDFFKRSLDQIMKKFYKDFLTEEELAKVQLGQELWLDSSQIGAKLSVMFETKSKEVEAEIAEMEAELAQLKSGVGELQIDETVAETQQKKPAAKKAVKKTAKPKTL